MEYELIEHEPVMSAVAEARAAERPPGQVAKTVVLHDGSSYLIAAIPAAERLDLHKLRELLGATGQLRLASEDEIAREFPTLEVGAVPAFGPVSPAVEVIDRNLLGQQRILCPAGDHRHSVTADICHTDARTTPSLATGARAGDPGEPERLREESPGRGPRRQRPATDRSPCSAA